MHLGEIFKGKEVSHADEGMPSGQGEQLMVRPCRGIPGASGKSKEATWMRWREPGVGEVGEEGRNMLMVRVDGASWA